MAACLSYADIQKGLAESEQFKHPLTRFLQKQGFRIERECLSEDPDSLFLGLKFKVGKAEIVYRLVSPEVVLIVSYRRLGQRKGMRNTFAEFFWFIELLTRPEFGLKQVIGCVDALKDSPLSSERILYLYTHCLNGKMLMLKDRPLWHTGTWVYLELKDYKPLRELWKENLKKEGRL